MDTRVRITECKNYNEESVSLAVRKILDSFGGASKLAAGKRVLIKPNLLMPKKPDYATTTHPSVVAALAREFVDAGCDVVIADSCGGPYNNQILQVLYRVTGMSEAASKTGARLNYDTSSSKLNYEKGKQLRNVSVISPVKNSDFVITVAKLKTHGFMYYTGAVKNLFGVIPGLGKTMMHNKFRDKTGFAEMIVDLCEAVSPSLSIIDGVIGMQGKGPSGGVPKYAGVLLGGINPHAVDLAAVSIMGLNPKNVPTLTDAMERGLIPNSVKLLSLMVDSPNNSTVDSTETDEIPKKHLYRFSPPPSEYSLGFVGFLPKFIGEFLKKLMLPYPYIIYNKCVGCGDCAMVCPQKTIAIQDKKAVINFDSCIKCYCCHELCPTKSIDFIRTLNPNKTKARK